MSTATSNLVRESVQPKFRRVDENGGHVYLFGERQVPGLTSVLEEMGFSDFGRVPKDVLERKARLGTAVHLACELSDKGELDDASVHPAVRPYLDAYLEFRSKVDVRTRFNEKGWDRIEEPMYQCYGVLGGGSQEPLEYATTVDRVGILGGEDHLGILEIKTTAKPEKAHRLQTVAQGDCLEARRECPRFALYLKPDGKYKLEKHKDYSMDALAWRQVLSSYHWRKIYG